MQTTSPASGNLSVTVHQPGIALVELSRGKVNAIDGQMYEDIAATFDALSDDQDVRVIVLTGQNDQDNALRAIRMGARYSDREQTRRYSAYNWGAISESWAGGISPFQTTGPLAVEQFDFPNFQRGHNPTPMNGFYPTADLIAAYRDGTLQAALAAASSSGSRPDNATLSEATMYSGPFGVSRRPKHTGHTPWGSRKARMP